MWQGHTCNGLSYQSPWVSEISDVHLTMSTTSLLSGKPPVASLLWIRDPLTLTSKEVLRPTFPLTIAPEKWKTFNETSKKDIGLYKLLCLFVWPSFFLLLQDDSPGTSSWMAHWRSRMREAYPQDPQYSIRTSTISLRKSILNSV